MSSEKEEQKPIIPTKSSMEILSELFSTFHAEPPLIIKQEKSEESGKKHKKSKKKHKHKEKKHKKKDKKKKKRNGTEETEKNGSSSSSESEIDLAKILIKQEKDISEKKIKIEGTDLSWDIKLKNLKEEKNRQDGANSPVNENKGNSNHGSGKSKIVIKDLKLSSVFQATLKEIQDETKDEDGEISDTDDSSFSSKDKKKKKKHKHKSDSKKRSRSRSKDKSHKKLKVEDLRNKIKSEHKHGGKSRDRSKETELHRDRSKERDDDFYKGTYRSRSNDDHRSRERESTRESHRSKERYKDEYSRELDDYKRNRNRDSSFYKDDGFYKSRERERVDRDDKWFLRYRHRGYGERDRRYRSSSREREGTSKFDKKKLLEIARKNAITMMKSGSLPGALTLGPQAQEKVIAAIKSGGKTIEELTDFCKTLSKKEELGELSSLSEKDDSDSDTDKPFHHPFQLKDRPTSITMNIKNSVPLPIKSNVERTSELRMQFPVSSGQQHRKGEEWHPVSPPPPSKKVEEQEKPVTNLVASTSSIPLPIEAPPLPLQPTPVPMVAPEPITVPAPPNAPPGPQAFPTPMLEPTVDIGSIVSQRLTAMRRLQENPNDVQALTQMYKSNKEMQSWASSKQQLGQFTGSTGVQILSQAELSSGYQAWAKKDQLQTAAPVSGGMGMHLLQKMGWKPGEGLGKEKTGALEPLLLEVKLDKKGLVANEEQKGKHKKQKGSGPAIKTLQGKHPVSLLGEYASKRKLGAPQYVLEFECGPDHKKNFLFKVLLNGVEYKPNVASHNKKEAKAAAATLCLQQIGLLP